MRVDSETTESRRGHVGEQRIRHAEAGSTLSAGERDGERPEGAKGRILFTNLPPGGRVPSSPRPRYSRGPHTRRCMNYFARRDRAGGGELIDAALGRLMHE